MVPPIFFSFYCAVFGILLQPSHRIPAKPSSINSVTQFTRMRMPTRAILRSTFSYGFVPSWRSFFFQVSPFPEYPSARCIPFFFFQIRDQILILSYLLGTISFIYRCGLSTLLRSKLFEQNLHLTPSPNHWHHVGMLVRRFCL